MISVLIKCRLAGRTPRDNRGRGWGGAAASQGTPRIDRHHQKLGRDRKVSTQSQRVQGPADTLILNLQLPEWFQNEVLNKVLSHPSLWYFVMTVLGN